MDFYGIDLSKSAGDGLNFYDYMMNLYKRAKDVIYSETENDGYNAHIKSQYKAFLNNESVSDNPFERHAYFSDMKDKILKIDKLVSSDERFIENYNLDDNIVKMFDISNDIQQKDKKIGDLEHKALNFFEDDKKSVDLPFEEFREEAFGKFFNSYIPKEDEQFTRRRQSQVSDVLIEAIDNHDLKDVYMSAYNFDKMIFSNTVRKANGVFSGFTGKAYSNLGKDYLSYLREQNLDEKYIKKMDEFLDRNELIDDLYDNIDFDNEDKRELTY